MPKIGSTILAHHANKRGHRLWVMISLIVLALSGSAFAQGSIFGTVQNADLNNPAAGDLFWIGFLDDTDEEIRIESNVGAGYDGTNWFDDFQNYTTEAAGNPYDYFFVNIVNGEGFHLAGLIPNNSFQQENILLAPGTFPARPAGLIAQVASASRINISWNFQSGVTYHVYRRVTSNNGTFRRIDDPTGNLANPGVADSFFVDVNSDGVSDYTYIVMGEDASGNYSAHSVEFSVLASAVAAPTVIAVEPDSGSAVGTPAVTVRGTNFDAAGATVTFGGNPATNVAVISPFELTCNVPLGTPGLLVDVVVTNVASGIASAPLVSGFRYLGNAAPVLAGMSPQVVDEGQNLVLPVSASDLDGDSLILTAVNIPANATFTDNYDGTGTFDFNPDFTQAGLYNVTFIASDGSLADTAIVAITVNDVNQPPVLAAIGPQSVIEGQNLNLGVSATDLDGDSLTMSAENVPLNATFTDNWDGTGIFDFNPDFLQAGVYNVTFIASDGVLADTEIVAITVNEAGNQPPVWSPIGPQLVDEGQNLNVGVSAADPDLDSLVLTAENVPANTTFTDNGDGTGIFDFNPDFTQAGIYNIAFIVSDGALADTEIVAITVNEAGNQAPAWNPVGSQVVDEGQNLNLGVSASDPDADSLTLTAENVPPNATFTDNGDNTGTFNFTPDFVQAGIYNVTFIASDGALADTEIVAITVNEAGNQRPAFDPIADTAVDENVLLVFTVTASDLDGDSLILTAENLPPNATFADFGDGTGSFNFIPDYTQAGIYSVTFIASDGALADTAIVAVTVNDANEPPVLTPIGSQLVDEGQNLNFGLSASDPQGDSIVLTAENVPLNATLVDNGDGTGVFDFNPDFMQSGVYNVTFIASDIVLADTEIVAITVNEVGNQRPVLAPISDTTIDENTILALGISAFEPDGDSLILTAENVPLNAIFTDNGDGTGVLDFSPNFFQDGVYPITFIASDGLLADTAIVQVTVNNVNQIPVLSPIGPLSVLEGDTLSILIAATDADSVIPSITVENLPAGAEFADSANGTGGLFFVPQYDQAGLYQLLFIASDGVDADSELVDLAVIEAGNQPPLLALIGDQAFPEGDTLLLRVTATDPDGDNLVLTALGLPPNATFADSLNGVGGFEFTPDYLQGGNDYLVTFIASDGALADSEVVLISVTDLGNLPPVIDSIEVQTVGEGDTLVILVHAADPEGGTVSINYSTTMEVAAFFDSGNGYATWEYEPGYYDAGVDTVTFIATDDGTPATSAFMEVEIITVDVNQAPFLVEIGPQAVLAADSLKIRLVATDSTSGEGNILYMTASSLPANATFVDSGGGVAGFVFYPDFSQIGADTVTFRVTDNGVPALSDQEAVEITVVEQNRPPVLDYIGPQIVNEGDSLEFRVSATDPDGTIPALSVQTVLENYTFVDSGNGAGSFKIVAAYTQGGLHDVLFIADDGIDTDEENVILQIIEAGNQAPVLYPIGPLSVTENEMLGVLITAYDLDKDSLVLEIDTLIANCGFTDNGDGSALFTVNPEYWQDSTYDLLFTVSDGQAADSEVVVLTIIDAGNQLPQFIDLVGPQAITEIDLLEFRVFAADPDSTIPILSTGSLPGSAAFTDSGGGVGGFRWPASYDDQGVHYIDILAIDAEDPALVETLTVEITVEDVNRAPGFTSAPIEPLNVDEGDTVWATAQGTDPDGPAPKMDVIPPLANLTATDLGGGSIELMFTPNYTQSGDYQLFWIAVDSVYPADTAFSDLRIFVSHVNLAPEIAPIAAQTTMEGENLNFQISAADPDGSPIPRLSAFDLPANATFVDNEDGTGIFDFNPDYAQAGDHFVGFTAWDGALTDTAIVQITVYEAGEAPVLTPIGPQGVTEGQNLTFGVSATDADGTTPALIAESIPANGTFTDHGNGTGTFDFNPDYTQTGVYNVRFIAFDGFLADSEIVEITVASAGNQAPIMAAIGPQVTTEGVNLNFVVSANDPDGPPPSLIAEDLPANATFADNADGTGVFDFTPDYTQANLYNVRFIASDGVLADTELVQITVAEAGNQAPSFLEDPPDLQLVARKLFALRLEAVDPEGTPLTLTAVDLPANATFTDSGNGIGGFEFTPDVSQANADFTVLFVASDGEAADTVQATYSVIAYIIGDVNADGSINPLDVTLLVNYVFFGWTPPVPVPEVGDVNCDGNVNPVDVTQLQLYVFFLGPPPPEYCP